MLEHHINEEVYIKNRHEGISPAIEWKNLVAKLLYIYIYASIHQHYPMYIILYAWEMLSLLAAHCMFVLCSVCCCRTCTTAMCVILCWWLRVRKTSGRMSLCTGRGSTTPMVSLQRHPHHTSPQLQTDTYHQCDVVMIFLVLFVHVFLRHPSLRFLPPHLYKDGGEWNICLLSPLFSFRLDHADYNTEESYQARDYLAATMQFIPGHFACDVVWSTIIHIHPRLKMGPNMGVSRGEWLT